MGYKVKWVEDNLGVTRKALRVFEKAGLMPENKGGQYRDYDDDDIDHIWTIRVLQGMGYSIKEICDMVTDDGFDFDTSISQKVEQLEEKKVDIVHISPSHHYPTGIVMPISRRYELLGWASKGEGRYIIEDDYDSELRLGGKPIPTLQSIDISEKVIYMNTFTKTLASTVRISYMILPRPLLEQFYQKLSFYSCTVSNFEQYTLDLFIKEGYFEKHINRMRTYYRKIRDELLDAIANSALATHCNIAEEDSGLHFLLHIDTSLPDDALSAKAKEYGLHLSFLSEYYEKGSPNIPAHTLIINYSGLTSEKIPQVITLLSKCILT